MGNRYVAVGDIYFSSTVNSSDSYRTVSRIDVEVSADSRVFCRNCNAAFADFLDSYVVSNFILNGKLSCDVFVAFINFYAVGVCYCKLSGVNRNLRVQLATAGKLIFFDHNGVFNLVEAFEFIDRNVNRAITREVCVMENYSVGRLYASVIEIDVNKIGIFANNPCVELDMAFPVLDCKRTEKTLFVVRV